MPNIWIGVILLILGFFFGVTRAGKALAVLYALIFIICLGFSYFTSLPEVKAGNLDTVENFTIFWILELVKYYLPLGIGYLAGDSLSMRYLK